MRKGGQGRGGGREKFNMAATTLPVQTLKSVTSLVIAGIEAEKRS